jgi:hypothetical protein
VWKCEWQFSRYTVIPAQAGIQSVKKFRVADKIKVLSSCAGVIQLAGFPLARE